MGPLDQIQTTPQMLSNKDKVHQMWRTNHKNVKKLEENLMLIKLKMRKILKETGKEF